MVLNSGNEESNCQERDAPGSQRSGSSENCAGGLLETPEATAGDPATADVEPAGVEHSVSNGEVEGSSPSRSTFLQTSKDRDIPKELRCGACGDDIRKPHSCTGETTQTVYQEILEVVRGWAHHWTYNEPGYEDRGRRVADANMSHDLARRLTETVPGIKWASAGEDGDREHLTCDNCYRRLFPVRDETAPADSALVTELKELMKEWADTANADDDTGSEFGRGAAFVQRAHVEEIQEALKLVSEVSRPDTQETCHHSPFTTFRKCEKCGAVRCPGCERMPCDPKAHK